MRTDSESTCTPSLSPSSPYLFVLLGSSQPPDVSPSLLGVYSSGMAAYRGQPLPSLNTARISHDITLGFQVAMANCPKNQVEQLKIPRRKPLSLRPLASRARVV